MKTNRALTVTPAGAGFVRLDLVLGSEITLVELLIQPRRG
jgi:hypothetical protein